MGTIEYKTCNNSTFANYPVSAIFRTCKILGFLSYRRGAQQCQEQLDDEELWLLLVYIVSWLLL